MNFDIKKPIEIASLGNLKQLFYSSFQNGINTYRDWAILANDTGTGGTPAFVAGSKNASITDDAYRVLSNNASKSANIFIESTGDADDLFTANSFSSIKLPKNGLTFLCFSGKLGTLGENLNSTLLHAKLRYEGNENLVSQNNWNIDGMGIAENYRNPSGVILDFTRPQTACLISLNGGDDGLLLSFLVNGFFYPAHFIAASNVVETSTDLTTQNILQENLSVCFQAKKQASSSTFDVGYIGSNSEFSFEINRSYVDPEAETTTYAIDSISCFTTGDNVNINQFPYTANSVDSTNGFSYWQVLSSNTTLLQLMMSTFADNLNQDSGTFTVDEVEVSVIGRDLDQACLVEIGYNRHIGFADPPSYISAGASSNLAKALPDVTPSPSTTPIFTDSILVNVGETKKLEKAKLDLQKFPSQLGVVVVKWGSTRYFLRQNLVVRVRGVNPFSSADPSMYASAVVNGYEQT